MMTPEEGAKLKLLKGMVLSGGIKSVTREEKQWILNLLKREKVAVRSVVKTAAENSGFDVRGINTI